MRVLGQKTACLGLEGLYSVQCTVEGLYSVHVISTNSPFISDSQSQQHPLFTFLNLKH